MKFILKIITFYLKAFSWINPRGSARHAFYLFAFPFKAKLQKHHHEFLNSSHRFSISFDNKKIQCYKWGNGKESVLFVHGWQSNSYRWKSYIQAFDKTQYTLYAFDAPGHGNSGGRICTIPLYEKTIDTLIREHGDMDHFIGHSIGSFACASFMFHQRYPVGSYISLASPYDANEFIADFNSKLKFTEKANQYLAEYFKSYAGYPISHYSHDTFLKRIKPRKTLIIHDKQDQTTSYENAYKMQHLLQKANRNVELVISDGFYHKLRNENLVLKVVDFLKQH